MVTGIIGRKVGMTQIFDADGTIHPATVIKAGPCVVVQTKTAQTDGYEAVQLGLVEEAPAKVGKPLAGHYKKAGVPPTRVRREVKPEAGKDAPKVGEQVLASIFASGDRVDIVAIASSTALDDQSSIIVRGAMVSSVGGASDGGVGSSDRVDLNLEVPTEEAARAVVDAAAKGGVSLIAASTVTLDQPR